MAYNPKSLLNLKHIKKGTSGNPAGRPPSLANQIKSIPKDAQTKVYEVLHHALSLPNVKAAKAYLESDELQNGLGEYGFMLQIAVKALMSKSGWLTVCDILDRYKESGARDKIVIDVCSTKEQINLSTHYHPCRGQYVSTHPMAGTEYSGPWAAMPNLFDGRACIFANTEDSDPKAVKTVEKLYDVLNMRPIYMDASSHDVHTAYVSHISHVISFALALTVLDKVKDEKHIFDLASGGFSSTVRLAKSNADMWVPILTQNHDNVLQVIDTYIQKMQAFRDAIADYDGDKVRSLIEEANRIKKILR